MVQDAALYITPVNQQSLGEVSPIWSGSGVGQRAASCKLQMSRARWIYVEISVLKLSGFETPFEIHLSLICALTVGSTSGLCELVGLVFMGLGHMVEE